MDAITWEAIGSVMAGGGTLLTASITFVFYRELTKIERERSVRETQEYQRKRTEKAEAQERQFFEKRVRDFEQELLARSSDTYPVFEVMIDLARGSGERRKVALSALERYLERKERVPSERDSLRAIIMESLADAEPNLWRTQTPESPTNESQTNESSATNDL